MTKHKIIASFFINIFVIYATADDSKCCDTGSFVRRNLTTDGSFCFNPDSNYTSELSLKCDADSNTVVIQDKTPTHNCSKQDAGHVDCILNGYSYTKLNGTYCQGTKRVLIRKNKEEIPVILFCRKKEPDLAESDKVKSYFMIVSFVFLLITAVIYGALPELRDLEGWSIINLCVSLAIAFGLCAAMNLIPYTSKQMNQCAAKGFLAYFFIIAAFFWMNAISVQILNNIRQSIIRPFGNKQLLFYMLYAWGCPALLTAIVAIVNYIEGDHARPGIGLMTCWFYDHYQTWIYFYSVMMILIVVNIGIFVYISVHLWNHKFSSNTITALKYKFFLSFRLLIVMGLPWIFEMISSVFERNIILDILDIVNLLVGLSYFLFLVVLRRRTIKALYRHGWLCCCNSWVERYVARAEDDEDQNIQHTHIPSIESPAE